MRTRSPRTRICTLLLAGATALPLALAAQEGELPPEEQAPVRIEPEARGQVESMRMADGRIRYKVTPRNGKPYCVLIEERDPFDPTSTGANYRIPCD